MHIKASPRRNRNVLAAWALSVADAVRLASEGATGLGGELPGGLVAIVADPGLSIGELRKILELTHPGTVRLVDRLVEQGWVRRVSGTGRTVHLEPTAAGRRAERRVAVAREQAVTDLLAALPDDQLAIMARLVDPLLARTSNDAQPMRRLCRLCDRRVCTPCPAEQPE